jgi:hypothetical protein
MRIIDTNSGLCPVVGFGISSIEPLGPTTIVLVGVMHINVVAVVMAV